MRYKSENNSLSIVKNAIEEYVEEGDIVLDATIGNGNDTLALAKRIGYKGKIYGFDIQDIAIENTKNLLIKNDLLDNTILIKDSHENIHNHIKENLDFVIYNLGYLPKGDKKIKTMADSTVNSIEKALELLKLNGIMIITVYTGHPGGMEEKAAIENLIINLEQIQFNVLKYEFINQRNSPPLVYRIEKIKF